MWWIVIVRVFGKGYDEREKAIGPRALSGNVGCRVNCPAAGVHQSICTIALCVGVELRIFR